MSARPESQNRVTVSTLQKMKQQGDRIAMLTAYDASFASVLDGAGVDIVLVGDSLGMVVQGHETTVPVTVDDIAYHCACVAKAAGRMLVMADMPFMSFRDVDLALENATQLMQEGGAHMVKLEGGGRILPIIDSLASHGIPVCGHIGLQPQSIHKLGAYRVQGRSELDARNMLNDARAMEDAGADVILMECVPTTLAAEITRAVNIPTIGIGAGPDCDGQVLVLYDLLGISPGHRPKFAEDFLTPYEGSGGIPAAVKRFVDAVKQGHFPDAVHSFS